MGFDIGVRLTVGMPEKAGRASAPAEIRSSRSTEYGRHSGRPYFFITSSPEAGIYDYGREYLQRLS